MDLIVHKAEEAVAQRLAGHDMIVAGLPQVLSTKHTVIILEECSPLLPDLLLEHGLA